MPTPHRRPGFTLIELLIVVVIIGILATIAAPRFRRNQERAMLAAAHSDLRALAVQQEIYYGPHGAYAGDASLLGSRPSPGVAVTITHAAPDGWAATTVHAGLPGTVCGIYFGAAPPEAGAPATQPATAVCAS
jgi:prepilin-type N-terminal cleavage/methylation domain-containing protein